MTATQSKQKMMILQDTESGFSGDRHVDRLMNFKKSPYNLSKHSNIFRYKTTGLRSYQSGHSMPKTATNFIKMKKGLYMNETINKSMVSGNQSNLFNGSEDQNQYKNISYSNFRKGNKYESSPANVLRMYQQINSPQKQFTEPNIVNSLEGKFDTSIKLSPDQLKSIQMGHGFLSDLDEFMTQNYNTTMQTAESKNAYVRSSAGFNTMQTQKKLAIQKLRYIRKQKKILQKESQQ